MKYRLAASVFAPALALGGCAGMTPVLAPQLPEAARHTAVELEAIPFFPQTLHQCGPAALATVLQASGVEVSPDALVAKVYLPEKKGSLQSELVAATRGYGRMPYAITPDLPTLLAEIKAGRPVLVLQNLGVSFYPAWHYAVVIGYVPDDDAVILRSGTTRRRVMSARRFLRTWRLAGSWGFVALRPGEFPALPAPAAYLQAAADLEAVDQLQSAALAYAAAVAHWPDNATAWLGLGNTQYQRGDRPGAERSYRRATEADPSSLAAWNNLAEVLAQRGDLRAALAMLDDALGRPGGNASLRGHLEQTRADMCNRRPAGDPALAAACRQGD